MYPIRPRKNRWKGWVRFRDVAKNEVAALNTGERLFFDILFIIGLAPLPLWFFVHHGAWDGAFWLTFKHLYVPILLVVAIGSRLFMPRFWAESGWLSRGFTVVLTAAMLTFMAQVHVSAINQWYGESVSVVISGTVLDKFHNQDGGCGVRVETSSGTLKLRVTCREYAQIEVGDAFSRRYMRGSLGLLQLCRSFRCR
jgi:hypothetical protein